MNKLRTTLVAALLLFTVNAALAQEKYEYAVVRAYTQTPTFSVILVTVSGKAVERIPIKWEKVVAAIPDYTPFLDQIEKMSDEGWEVITVDNDSYYLKRKKVR
jgi:hypothetical protein